MDDHMKILVSIKRVIDYNVSIRVKPDGSGVEHQNTKMSINPFDSIALEEAVRLKEKDLAKEIMVVSIGDETCQESLRQALALGADRAILVQTNTTHEPFIIANMLADIVHREKPDLVLMGKQAIDDDCSQTGQMLAGLLDWPQATFASKILFKDQELFVTREVDGGLETLSVSLPAVITVDLRLNEPRYASLPNIMQAKRKTIEVLPMTTDITPHTEILSIFTPPQRATGVLLASVDELVEKLKSRGLIS
jgi:electron transfer flavoprotein beta subunit